MDCIREFTCNDCQEVTKVDWSKLRPDLDDGTSNIRAIPDGDDFKYVGICDNCGHLEEIEPPVPQLKVTNVDVQKDGMAIEVTDEITNRSCWIDAWKSGDEWTYDFSQNVFHPDDDNDVVAQMFQKDIDADDLYNCVMNAINEHESVYDSLQENKSKTMRDRLKEVKKESNKVVEIWSYGKIYYEFPEQEWRSMSEDERDDILLDTADQSTEEEGHPVYEDEVEIVMNEKKEEDCTQASSVDAGRVDLVGTKDKKVEEVTSEEDIYEKCCKFWVDYTQNIEMEYTDDGKVILSLEDGNVEHYDSFKDMFDSLEIAEAIINDYEQGDIKELNKYGITEEDVRKLADELGYTLNESKEVKTEEPKKDKTVYPTSYGSNTLDVNKIAEFLKGAITTLTTTQYTCTWYDLDKDLAIFAGWSGGYDPNDGGYIHDKDNPEYVIEARIASTHEYMKTDLDWLTQPYDKDSGEVWDTSITLTEGNNFEEDAKWFIDEYKGIRQALDNGELLLENKKVKTESVSTDVIEYFGMQDNTDEEFKDNVSKEYKILRAKYPDKDMILNDDFGIYLGTENATPVEKGKYITVYDKVNECKKVKTESVSQRDLVRAGTELWRDGAYIEDTSVNGIYWCTTDGHGGYLVDTDVVPELKEYGADTSIPNIRGFEEDYDALKVLWLFPELITNEDFKNKIDLSMVTHYDGENSRFAKQFPEMGNKEVKTEDTNNKMSCDEIADYIIKNYDTKDIEDIVGYDIAKVGDLKSAVLDAVEQMPDDYIEELLTESKKVKADLDFEDIVKDSIHHLKCVDKDISIDNLFNDIVNNYNQNYISDKTFEDMDAGFNSIRYILNKNGIKYIEEECKDAKTEAGTCITNKNRKTEDTADTAIKRNTFDTDTQFTDGPVLLNEDTEDEIPVVNPDDKDYYNGHGYIVSLYPGFGALLTSFKVYCDDIEPAIEKVVAYAEENGYSSLLLDTGKMNNMAKEDLAYGKAKEILSDEEFKSMSYDDKVKAGMVEVDKMMQDDMDAFYDAIDSGYLADLIYIDATMEGAKQCYYIYNDLQIEEFDEGKVEESKKVKIESLMVAKVFKNEDEMNKYVNDKHLQTYEETDYENKGFLLIYDPDKPENKKSESKEVKAEDVSTTDSEFKLYIPTEQLADVNISSLLFESHFTIATLKEGAYELSLMVNGDVSITDTETGEQFFGYNDFSDDLIASIKDGSFGDRYDASLNNWFEWFLDKDGEEVWYDVADIEGLLNKSTPEENETELEVIMKDTMDDIVGQLDESKELKTEDVSNIDYEKYLLYGDDEVYPVIKVNGEYYITRQGTADFSGQWKLLGFVAQNSNKQISVEDALNIENWRYKNGNPKYTVIDFDHGSVRRWGGSYYGARRGVTGFYKATDSGFESVTKGKEVTISNPQKKDTANVKNNEDKKVSDMEDLDIILGIEEDGNHLVIRDVDDWNRVKALAKSLSNSQGFYGRYYRNMLGVEESFGGIENLPYPINL